MNIRDVERFVPVKRRNLHDSPKPEDLRPDLGLVQVDITD